MHRIHSIGWQFHFQRLNVPESLICAQRFLQEVARRGDIGISQLRFVPEEQKVRFNFSVAGCGFSGCILSLLLADSIVRVTYKGEVPFPGFVISYNIGVAVQSLAAKHPRFIRLTEIRSHEFFVPKIAVPA